MRLVAITSQRGQGYEEVFARTPLYNLVQQLGPVINTQARHHQDPIFTEANPAKKEHLMSLMQTIMNPSAFNQVQRAGAFIAITLLLLLVVLHNPMQGYQTEVWVSCTDIPEYLCPKEPRKLNLLEWRSTGAMIAVFEPMGTGLLCATAIFVALMAWLELFKTKVK